MNFSKHIALCVSSMISASYAGAPLLYITPVQIPLTIRSIPVQDSLANSTFHFDLKPYIYEIQPEVAYRLSLHPALPRAYNSIGLMPLPAGITRVYDQAGDCQRDPITLGPNQSCLLRFYVDKSTYTGSPNGPIVCLKPPLSCYQPLLGQQLGNTVPNALLRATAEVTPLVENGLTYNADTATITGKPMKTGVYHFTIGATNGTQTAIPIDLEIQANVNPKDKPVFKYTRHMLLSAMPDQDYRVDLMSLIEPTAGFMVTNQLSFHLDCRRGCPEWLSVEQNEATVLQGHIPLTEAGKTVEVRLIATSNSGGDSDPLTIEIPVASDPARKPVIDQGIELTGIAGEAFDNDFRSHIHDPEDDDSLRILIDKIEPEAPWLSKAPSNPTELHGVIPKSAVGQEYQITLRAATTTGGASDAVTIPLKVAINKNLTPRFSSNKPQLPLVYEGQSYEYDFAAGRGIYPEYSDIPFTVELAEGYNNPTWVRIEDNKLIIDKVPENLEEIERIFITIKNVPGGKSNVLTLDLFIMN